MSAAPWRPVVLVLASSTSLQAGLAIAATTFATVGPLSAVWVRSVVGAGLLWAYIRPPLSSITRSRLRPIGAYGLALACMTTFAYLAIDNAPLGIVSAILMLGPLGIAAWGNRSPFDLTLVGVAATGALILCLASGVGGPVSAAGLGFAFAGAASFAAYIVAGKRVNADGQGLSGLALALVVAAALQTPLGIAFARPGLLDAGVLATLALAGVLATLVPFTLEAIALRTLSMAAFGLLLAFEPAVATVAGVVIRGDDLSRVQLVGIALIVVAAAGSLGPRDWIRSMGSENSRIMADPKVAALARVALFDGLSARELASLSAAVKERHVDVGAVLTREGDEADDFFVIVSGVVGVSAHERRIRQLGAGDYLGEIALLFGGTRTATAVAEEASTLFVLNKTEFVALLATHPDIEEKILATVSERMRYR